MERKTLKPVSASASSETKFFPVELWKKAENSLDEAIVKTLDSDAAAGLDKFVNYNDLDVDEHRALLIKQCIETDTIFNDGLYDPIEKEEEAIGNQMFYNHLFMMVARQTMQGMQQGHPIQGLITGLSMFAGVAMLDGQFKDNIKAKAQDILLGVIDPVKDRYPKLYQQLVANRSSKAGFASPESIAIKLLRYQKQAHDSLENGASIENVEKQLNVKYKQLKKSADEMGIDWDDVVANKDALLKTIADTEANISKHPKLLTHFNEEGISTESTFGRDTKDGIIAVDAESAARKVQQYQDDLYNLINIIKNGERIPNRYAGLAKPDKYGNYNDLDVLKSFKKFGLDLKKRCDSLGLDWESIGQRYDELNRSRYDCMRAETDKFNDRISINNKHKYDEFGYANNDYGKPISPESFAPDELNEEGQVKEFITLDADRRDHNMYMRYELPWFASSAARVTATADKNKYYSERGLNGRDKVASRDVNIEYTKIIKDITETANQFGYSKEKYMETYLRDWALTLTKRPQKMHMLGDIGRYHNLKPLVGHVDESGTVFKNKIIGDGSVGEKGKPYDISKPENAKIRRQYIEDRWTPMYEATVYDENNKPHTKTIVARDIINEMERNGAIWQTQPPQTIREAKRKYEQLYAKMMSANDYYKELCEKAKPFDGIAVPDEIQSKINKVKVDIENAKCDMDAFYDGLTYDNLNNEFNDYLNGRARDSEKTYNERVLNKNKISEMLLNVPEFRDKSDDIQME